MATTVLPLARKHRADGLDCARNWLIRVRIASASSKRRLEKRDP